MPLRPPPLRLQEHQARREYRGHLAHRHRTVVQLEHQARQEPREHLAHRHRIMGRKEPQEHRGPRAHQLRHPNQAVIGVPGGVDPAGTLAYSD